MPEDKVKAIKSERFIGMEYSFGIPVCLFALHRGTEPVPPEKPHALRFHPIDEFRSMGLLRLEISTPNR
jgi:hypothetical protein